MDMARLRIILINWDRFVAASRSIRHRVCRPGRGDYRPGMPSSSPLVACGEVSPGWRRLMAPAGPAPVPLYLRIGRS
jgi:hypothetical protein